MMSTAPDSEDRLKGNPFSTRYWIPGAVPYEFDGDADLAGLADRIRCSSVVQVVGPHGSGKSTLLKSFARFFQQQGHEIHEAVLNDRQRRLPKDFFPGRDDENTVFLLDGYEQLSLTDRLLLRMRPWQRAAGVVLTTHRPARLIPILYRTVPRFRQFLQEVDRMTQGKELRLDERLLRRVFDQAEGNFRSAFFELYDLADHLRAASSDA